MNDQRTALTFENQVFHIGIDVHKRSWTVTIRNNNLELKTYSMKPDPSELAKHMNHHYPAGIYHSAYEAGFCGFWIHRELTNAGFDNIVVHAADVPTTNKEKVSKTDQIDSRKIAKHLESGDLNSIYVPGNKEQQLRSLCRLRFRVVSHSVRLKNRIKGHLAFYGIDLPAHNEMSHWSANFIRHLENMCFGDKPALDYLRFCLEELKESRERIAEITRTLKRYLRLMPEWDTVIRNLLSIPGIGFLTAATLYTEVIDVNRFENLNRLVAFVGLIPGTHSSGEHDRTTGMTSRKNPHLRYLLIEAAWIAVRRDPSMLKAFTELTKRMKKTEAIVRIARKLLNRIRFVWKQGEKYKCFC